MTAPGRGKFVVFEGGEGAGKSTQIAAVSSLLTAAGVPHVVTREPGGTQLGKTLRSLLLSGEDVSPETEALLFAADRVHHVQTVIAPALAAGEHVLCDRFTDSTYAYQGARGLDPSWAAGLADTPSYPLPVPDLTVLIDVERAVAARRAELRGELDRIELAGEEFHVRVRELFLSRSAVDPSRYAVIDGSLSPAEVTALIEGALRRLPGFFPGDIPGE